MLQNLGSDHLPILLSVPLSPAYRPNKRPPSFNFQKARWDDVASYFNFHCLSAEEYSSTCSSLSPESNPNLCTLFFAISLALLPRLPTLLTSPTLLLSEASLPPLRVTLTHFTLLSYEFHFILPFISLHSTSSKEALVACPPPFLLGIFLRSPWNPPFSLHVPTLILISLAHLDSLPPHALVLWTDGSVPFFLARAAPAFLPTALSVALRPLFPFRQAQYVSVFPLKPAPFCTLFAGLGNTIKSAIPLLLLSDSRSVLTTLSSPLSFFLSQTLWQIWQELSTLFSCSIRLQWVPGHSFLPGNDAADELARRGALLAPSAIPCSLFPLTSRIHSRLFLDWRRTVSSKYFDTQVPSISTEELVLPRHARCVLSRLRCNGHSLLLGSYLSRNGRIENPSCSACGHPSQDISHLILHCPATDSLRRSLFGNSLSLYDLWTRPWGVARLLGLHGLPPCPYPSGGVG